MGRGFMRESSEAPYPLPEAVEAEPEPEPYPEEPDPDPDPGPAVDPENTDCSSAAFWYPE